jgi:hypothetical protein
MFEVPQGSIFSSLLFIIYINLPLNLNLNTNSRLVLFADGTSAIITANNVQALQTKFEHTIIQID